MKPEILLYLEENGIDIVKCAHLTGEERKESVRKIAELILKRRTEKVIEKNLSLLSNN